MEQLLGNIFIRTMYFRKKGDHRQGHCHNKDHAHYILVGGEEIEFSKQHGWVHNETKEIFLDLIPPSVKQDKEWLEFRKTYNPNLLHHSYHVNA